MDWFSAETYYNAETVAQLTPLTSGVGREYARTSQDKVVPTVEEAREYVAISNLLPNHKQIAPEILLKLDEMYEDYRLDYDWRDRITTDKSGRMGVENVLGEMVVPNHFDLITERYASIDCHIPYYPVKCRGKFALMPVSDREITNRIPATPFEYDDAFLIPCSDGQHYAVREGEKWRVLRDVDDGLVPLCDFILDEIYPAITTRCQLTCVWPVKAGGKWGLLIDSECIAPEYDDFFVDYESGVVSMINDGEIVKTFNDDQLPY